MIKGERRTYNEEFKIYTAYGSNMNLEQMKKRCPNAEVIGTGELLGYKLTFRGKGEGFANVEVCDYGSVPIVLWAITKACEEALDRYEEYPTFYKKEMVSITTVAGEQTAMLYVMVKEYEDMPAIPSEHYFEILRQGYQDHEINLAPLIKAFEITRECV